MRKRDMGVWVSGCVCQWVCGSVGVWVSGCVRRCIIGCIIGSIVVGGWVG